MREGKGFHSYIFIIILLMFVLFAMNLMKKQDNDYTQTQLIADMEAKKVEQIYISPNSEAPTGYATVIFDNYAEKVYATDIRELEGIIREHGYEPIIEDIERDGWFITYVMPCL